MKKRTKQKLIYLRYILPPVLMLLILAAMLIPSYRYVSDGDINDTISAFSLIGNSYGQAREVLFGTDEQTNANLLFSRVLLIYILVATVLYAVALAAAIYSAVVAVRYFGSDDEEGAERSRTLFITFFPNRIILSIAEALCLGLAAFPYIMRPLYGGIYGMNVALILMAPDGLIIGGVLIIAIFILSAVCAPMERAFGADVFKKNRTAIAEKNENEEDYTPVFDIKDNVDSAEQDEKNRRIRELLGKKDS